MLDHNNNPYLTMVQGYADLMKNGRSLPLGGFEPCDIGKKNGPHLLIFSPHPDDESIIGGLALRLLRECNARVTNVAVTLGSKRVRQAARLEELKQACAYLGFDLRLTAPNGLDRIYRKTREDDPAYWAECVAIIAEILRDAAPDIILVPHAGDWNGTHIGTHDLVMDALARQDAAFSCAVVETEFWAPLDTPNLMVELSTDDLADLVAAISFHVGEVSRNPYHLTLPAWMQDNVRRGGELVGGQGGAAPDFSFATLYRLRTWKEGGLRDAFEGGRMGPKTQNLMELFT